MKAMYFAFLGIVVVAVIAHFSLDASGFSSAEVTAAPSVRLD